LTNPITPPPELVASLRNSAPHGIRDAGVTRELWLINHAYAAGAGQELEACRVWLVLNGYRNAASRLISAMQPKPPTLKEQALKEQALQELACVYNRDEINDSTYDIIRRALEAHPEPVAPVWADIHYAWELLDAEGDWQAGGSANSLDDVRREGNHCLQTYSQDGPHKLIIQRHCVNTIEDVTND
jgi:hypothetical protein